MRGGARPGSGPQKGAKYKPRAAKGKVKTKAKKTKEKFPKKPIVPQDIQDEAAAVNLTPLDYMLQVMNDTTADATRRDRMAQAAAPFVHPRKGEGSTGKKDEQATAAAKAGSGKFASMANRLKVVK